MRFFQPVLDNNSSRGGSKQSQGNSSQGQARPMVLFNVKKKKAQHTTKTHHYVSQQNKNPLNVFIPMIRRHSAAVHAINPRQQRKKSPSQRPNAWKSAVGIIATGSSRSRCCTLDAVLLNRKKMTKNQAPCRATAPHVSLHRRQQRKRTPFQSKKLHMLSERRFASVPLNIEGLHDFWWHQDVTSRAAALSK